ncbi:MAG: formate--tetrahydrofolate ligase [Candidatus Omnitrophica bacterium]|nr:formate--tetrahydrofolate ligase [Candidatus Omnitrophota bacterium]
MISDIEIAQRARPVLISEIARPIGIRSDEMIPHGNFAAKVLPSLLERFTSKPNGKLILVTSITPTKYGEGKTSTAIGLTQAFGKLKKRVMLCLREPSLGPMFGVKGGACGGGYSQVIPMDDINLHFTEDNYAIAAANNLLCAMLDSHIYFKNRLKIDPHEIHIRRAYEISDRTLRRLHFKVTDKFSYESGFDISAASETMAILALCKDLRDLELRLRNMLVAFNTDGKPVTVKHLNAEGAMGALLKYAIMPNLVQTIEGQPVLVHCGPFANIAHGANSLISTRMALKLANYVITESGFGADLGAEKFFDIVCRQGGLKADLAVVVVSARAIKVHGLDNLSSHINIIKRFGVVPIVAINRFAGDSQKDIQLIERHCEGLGVEYNSSDAVAKGGQGAVALAEKCVQSLQKKPSDFKFLYDAKTPVKEKIETIATQIYGAEGVSFSRKASAELKRIKDLGLDELPVNIAKTQFSLSDNPKLKGAPKGWRLKIKEIRIFAGAGFIVPIAGDIMLMPGLPEKPAACNIEIDGEGKIKGLF